jgi:DNA-directed RNA polymerase beta' subunit
MRNDMSFQTKILTFRQKRFLKSSQRRVLVDSLEIGLASPQQIREWAERRLPNKTLSGEVLTSKTVDYKTLKPIRDGLFCERIFGPTKDFVCSCGKKRTNRALPFCPECDVEHTESRVRRYRLGYINLISPVTHVWYLRGRPSYIATLLGRKRRSMEAIAYCTTFLPEHIPSYEDTERSFSFLNRKTVSTKSAKLRDEKKKKENYQEISQGIDIAFKSRPPLLSNAYLVIPHEGVAYESLVQEERDKRSISDAQAAPSSVPFGKVEGTVYEYTGGSMATPSPPEGGSLTPGFHMNTFESVDLGNSKNLKNSSIFSNSDTLTRDPEGTGCEDTVLVSENEKGFKHFFTFSKRSGKRFEKRSQIVPLEKKQKSAMKKPEGGASFSKETFVKGNLNIPSSLEKGRREEGLPSRLEQGKEIKTRECLETLVSPIIPYSRETKRKKGKEEQKQMQAHRTPSSVPFGEIQGAGCEYTGGLMATPSPRGGGRPSPLGKYKGRTANGSEKYLSNEVSKLPNLWELKMKKSSNQLISKKANIFHLKIKRKGISAGIPVGNLDTLVSRNLDTLVSPLLTPLGQYKGRDVNTQRVRWPPLFTQSEALPFGSEGAAVPYTREEPLFTQSEAVPYGREERETAKEKKDFHKKTWGGSFYPYPTFPFFYSQPQTLPISATFACDLDERAAFLQYITAPPLPNDKHIAIYTGVQRRHPLEIVYGLRGAHLLTGEEAVQEILSYTGGEAIRNIINRFDMSTLARFIRLEIQSLSLEIDAIGGASRSSLSGGKQGTKQLKTRDTKVSQFPRGIPTVMSPRPADRLGKLLKKRARQSRRLRLAQLFFKSCKKPEWMTLSVLPVLPPDLRPILRLDGDVLVVSDLNQLYQKVLFRNSRFRRLGIVTVESVAYAKGLLQEAVDALLDNGKGGAPPMVAPNDRPFKSLSDILKGKRGRFRQNLLGKRVDYSGRSVIVVGPKLLLHQCGLPREMGIELFQPFLIRKLLAQGFAHSIGIAKKMIQQGEPIVWELLHQLMRQHPILLNRAPTLHRLGIQAFQPKLVQGRAILLHPLVCTAFNADFDGDQMAVHVPLSVQARAEAWKLLWSRNNILSPATGQAVLIPSQDMVLGCYYLTQSLSGLSYSLKERKKLFNSFSNHVDRVGIENLDTLTRAALVSGISLGNFDKGRGGQQKETLAALPSGSDRAVYSHPYASDDATPSSPLQGTASLRVKRGGHRRREDRVTSIESNISVPERGPRSVLSRPSTKEGNRKEEVQYLETLVERSIKQKMKWFSGIEDIQKAYDQGSLGIQQKVWLRIEGDCENGNDPQNPIEIQVQPSAFCKKIYPRYQIHTDSSGHKIATFVQTTAGRVLVNEILNIRKLN